MLSSSSFQRTQRIKQHTPCGFAYIVVTPYDDYKQPVVVHRDNGVGNVAEVFVAMMHEEVERLHDLIHADEDMKPLTPEQKQAYNSSNICYLCNQPFAESSKKVMDHCHYT